MEEERASEFARETAIGIRWFPAMSTLVQDKEIPGAGKIAWMAWERAWHIP
jgi:hypothetical protein